MEMNSHSKMNMAALVYITNPLAWPELYGLLLRVSL